MPLFCFSASLSLLQVDEDGNTISGDDSEEEQEEKKEKIIYYITNEKQIIFVFSPSTSFITYCTRGWFAFRIRVVPPSPPNMPISIPGWLYIFKNEGIRFMRIDADVTDTMKSKTSKKEAENYKEKAFGVFRSAHAISQAAS